MIRLPLQRWSGAVLSPRTRPCARSPAHRILPSTRLPLNRTRSFIRSPANRSFSSMTRHPRNRALSSPTRRTLNRAFYSPPSRQSFAAAALQVQDAPDDNGVASRFHPLNDRANYAHLPSPPASSAASSARLAALHARLALSPRLPLETLARCLVDQTADPHPSFNNASLAVLGRDLVGYHTSELVLCTYPRLPMTIIFSAMEAYSGPSTLGSITRSWGVEWAAAPGGEVDPGLLQFVRIPAGNSDPTGTGNLLKDGFRTPLKVRPWAPGPASLAAAESHFGEDLEGPGTRSLIDYAERPELRMLDAKAAAAQGVTYDAAATAFVRAVFGAVYLHGGREAAKAFFRAHIAPRKLDVSKMFQFLAPTRDLSKLCAREGFDEPVARIVSETGRRSRSPVFVVGVFSGKEKLGEATGASLAEARGKAAIAALKAWYLYSPVDVKVPSDVEGGGGGWKGALVDGGEVVA